MRRQNLIALTILLAAALASLAGTGVARADTSTACDSAPVLQPFAPWGDLSWYSFVPNGGFEQGSSSWSLGGSAAVVDGNETFNVNDPGDSSSLALGPSGKATSDPMCVTPDDPTLRLFVRNTGDPSSQLKVMIRFTDVNGLLRTVPVAYLSAGSDWQPSDLIPVTVSQLAPVLAGGPTDVSFRFASQNDGGVWSIDDVYLDPFKTK
jgi:hypothetical protein